MGRGEGAGRGCEVGGRIRALRAGGVNTSDDFRERTRQLGRVVGWSGGRNNDDDGVGGAECVATWTWTVAPHSLIFTLRLINGGTHGDWNAAKRFGEVLVALAGRQRVRTGER